MPTAKVKRYDVPKGVFTLISLEQRFDAEVNASLVTVPAVEDLAFVEHDRGQQAVIADAVDQ